MKVKFTDKDQKQNGNQYEKYGITKRLVPRWQWYLTVFIAFAPFVYFLYKIVGLKFFTEYPGFIISDQVVIRAPDEGYVRNIYYQNGDLVENANLILDFESPKTDNQIIDLDANIRLAKQNRENLLVKKAEEKIQLESLYNKSLIDLAENKKNYEFFKEKFDQGIIPQLQLSGFWNNYANSLVRSDEIKLRLDELDYKYKTEIVNNYSNKIEELKIEKNKLLSMKYGFAMTAPANGQVISVDSHPREFITKGSTLLKIATFNNYVIQAYVAAKNINEVYVGKQITIIFPDKTKIKAKIIKPPRFAERLPASASTSFGERKNDIVIIAKPEIDFPERYKVFNAPVDVRI